MESKRLDTLHVHDDLNMRMFEDTFLLDVAHFLWSPVTWPVINTQNIWTDRSEWIVYACLIYPKYIQTLYLLPASVAQLDARLTGDQEIADSNPARWQHSFMEIDREIFSMVILSLLLIQEGQLSASV